MPVARLLALALFFVALAMRLEARRGAAVIAFLCLAFAQVAFWLLTFPGNARTLNWTMLPIHGEELRLRWELGHAIGAMLTLMALVALLTIRLRAREWRD